MIIRLSMALIACGLAALASPITGSAHADTIAVGFFTFPDDLNVLRSNDAVARMVRDGISKSLVEVTDGPIPYRLWIADSVNISADQRQWSFRIRAGEKFHNGEEVSADDVVFSIGQCRARGELADMLSVTPRRTERVAGAFENWVDFKVRPSSTKTFPLGLANCPIIELSSAELFGNQLGKGSNLVTSGNYFISDFSPGKEFTLNKFNQISQEGASEIVLRYFKDPLHGLTALRSGTVDALYQPSEEVILKAERDSTLKVENCFSGKLVLRKGFNLACREHINLAKLRYTN